MPGISLVLFVFPPLLMLIVLVSALVSAEWILFLVVDV